MMKKLNTTFYPDIYEDILAPKEVLLDPLKNNDFYNNLEKSFLKEYNYSHINSFSFNKSGFLSLMLELSKNKSIAVSLGESDAVYEAAKIFEELGFEVIWLNLFKNGQVDLANLKNRDIDLIFISSYVMDTFIKTNIKDVKKYSDAKIISNASFDFTQLSDYIYFDTYKLTGSSLSSVILSNENLLKEQVVGYKDSMSLYLINKSLKSLTLSTQPKNIFLDILQHIFKDDIYFFVDPKSTFDFTLHIGLKGIKARELIRTLVLDGVTITNGEGCSLGLAKPSRVIQTMGYSEDISRNAISLSFSENLDEQEIENIVKLMFKRYRQIKVLG